MPIFKKIYTNPKNNEPDEWVTFSKDCDWTPFCTYTSLEIVSSDEFDYSKIDGERLSYLLMLARVEMYNDEVSKRYFFESLSETEQFLYMSFVLSSL